jgi:hypothetical protein
MEICRLRASDFDSEGRRFESFGARQNIQIAASAIQRTAR